MLSHSMTARTKAAVGRKDVQEEFFKLLIVAFKMNHVSIYPTIMNVSHLKYLLKQIDSSELFKQVLQTKKPFYEWP